MSGGVRAIESLEYPGADQGGGGEVLGAAAHWTSAFASAPGRATF